MPSPAPAPADVDTLLRHAWGGDTLAARRMLLNQPALAKESLFTAAACGDLAEVERLLALDASAARLAGGPLAWPALAYVAYGRLDDQHAPAIARRLLDAGADPCFRFDDGWGNAFSLVAGAIGLGEGARPSHPQAPELVDMLVGAGADPFDLQALYNVSIVGDDTTWYEVLWRHCEQRGLAGRWADAGSGRPGGSLEVSTLDHLLGNAIGQNHLLRAEWLLARGALPDAPHAYGGPAVHALAQLSGFVDMAALLERYGARPVPLSGAQAFRAACLRVDDAAARTLLAANPSFLDDPETLLAAAEFGNARAIALLLSLGASPAQVDGAGISPLHRAAQSGSLEAVDLLLAAGAAVDLHEGRWNGTPLSWSVVLGRPQVTRHLLPISRDVRTLVYLGALDRLAAVLQAEPERADQVLPDANAPTALFVLPDDPTTAAAAVRLLLASGADPARRNQKGQTPGLVANERGLQAAADLLQRGQGAASWPEHAAD